MVCCDGFLCCIPVKWIHTYLIQVPHLCGGTFQKICENQMNPHAFLSGQLRIRKYFYKYLHCTYVVLVDKMMYLYLRRFQSTCTLRKNKETVLKFWSLISEDWLALGWNVKWTINSFRTLSIFTRKMRTHVPIELKLGTYKGLIKAHLHNKFG